MRGKGPFDPEQESNSYPMTDIYQYPTLVKVKVNGKVVDLFYLEDDPQTTWCAFLVFAASGRKTQGSRLLRISLKSNIPLELLNKSSNGKVNIRFEVDEALPGGLAIYGKLFGRYPMDPTLLFE